MTALFDATPAAPAAGPRSFTIELPAGLPLLNANRRHHHRVRHDRTKTLRAAAMEAVAGHAALMAALAAAKPGPLFQRAHVLGVMHPATARRADPANWYPSFKACVDGLVDAGLLDDDDHTRLVGPDMRLGEKRKGSQLVLVVTALGPGEDPLMGAAR
jgi:crossover junction endodeoxyribonuclease RusA